MTDTFNKVRRVSCEKGLIGIPRRLVLRVWFFCRDRIVRPLGRTAPVRFCQDLSSFVRDIQVTRYVRQHLNTLRSSANLQTIRDFHVADFKHSNTLFILGCGASIDKLTDHDWAVISKHDSVGFNFWCIHDFVPTFYFLEPNNAHADRHAALMSLLDRRKTAYAHVPFIYDYKNWYCYNRRQSYLDDIPQSIRANLYYHSPFYLNTRTPHLMAWALRFWRVWHYLYRADFGWMIHHRASISALVMFGVIAGYREIVLVGVDLNNSKYFWEERPELYDGRDQPRNIEPPGVHGTIDPKITEIYHAIPIDQYLDLFDRIVLRPNQIRLSLASAKSRLYPRFPLNKIIGK